MRFDRLFIKNEIAKLSSGIGGHLWAPMMDEWAQDINPML